MYLRILIITYVLRIHAIQMYIYLLTWSERVTNFNVQMRTGQPLLSDTVRTRHLKLFDPVARAEKSQDYSCALQACISTAPRNWRWHPGRPRHSWLRKVEEDCANLILVSHQGSVITKQNNLADYHRNSNVTDKLRLTSNAAAFWHNKRTLCTT